ncbi:MAG: secretin N-terminal domain-containing protein [Dehalococcoidales bacterium]|jgi:type II secretory pathway component GspD/PulD (secretin)
MGKRNRFKHYISVVVILPLIFLFVVPVQAQSPVAPQKITLDIKGMDIIDVLKIVSQRTGMNIVASKSVTGRVTIFLKEVDVWDAFEIILLSNDLAYDVNNNIVNVMTGREYEAAYGERYKDRKEIAEVKLNYAKAIEVAKALAQIKTAVGKVVVDEGSNTIILMDCSERLAQMKGMIATLDSPTITKVFPLDYAKSEKLNAKIQDMSTKGLGSVRFDERTNTVVVCDLPEKVSEIEKVISAFDEKTRQVLIDAKIVQVELDDKFTMGIDWKLALKHLTAEQTLTAGLTTGGKITVSAILGDRSRTFDSVIDALKEIGKTELISSPRITALDGQEAKIMVGTKEAFITATTITPATGAVTTSEQVNFVDVGIQLYVTPSVNKDGFVTMRIRPVVSSVASRIKTTASPDGVPIVKTSEAETSVSVRDGVTLVMGGLIEDKIVKTENRIPFLGDIPILGVPFRQLQNEKKKTELVIFLTPTVISGESAEKIPYMERESYSEYYDDVRDNVQAKDLYYQSVRSKILKTALKYHSDDAAKGSVVVAFCVGSDGTLRDEPVIVNRADPDLAELAVRCVIESQPFEHFPEDLPGHVLSVKVPISFE